MSRNRERVALALTKLRSTPAIIVGDGPPPPQYVDQFMEAVFKFAHEYIENGCGNILMAAADRFEDLTGPGTEYDLARLTAVDSLRAAELVGGYIPWPDESSGPSPGVLSSVGPTLGGPENGLHRLIRLVAEPESVLWCTTAVLEGTKRALEPDARGIDREVISMWFDHLERVARHEELTRQVRGACLIVRIHRAFEAGPTSAERRKALDLLPRDWERIVREIREAAEYLFAEVGQAQLTAGKTPRGFHSPGEPIPSEFNLNKALTGKLGELAKAICPEFGRAGKKEGLIVLDETGQIRVVELTPQSYKVYFSRDLADQFKNAKTRQDDLKAEEAAKKQAKRTRTTPEADGGSQG
jgi:hypothetical protein